MGRARAGPGAIGLTRLGPHLRELTPPGKTLELEMLHFLLFESVSKRDIERDMSAIFVSRKAQCESGGMLQQN